jgi:hypothetical protein
MLLPLARPCAAETLFPAGTESKQTGLESAAASEGAPALLYNPANLRIRGHGRASEPYVGEPYVEVGFVSVAYTYEHPDFDPVHVAITSPTATAGYAARLPYGLTAGLVIFPENASQTEIPGLPRKVGSEVIPLDVSTTDRVIDVGAGLSARLGGNVALGLAAVHSIEQHALTARLVDSDSHLIDMSYKGQFTRPVAGLRVVPNANLALGLALRPPLRREYQGSQVTAAEPDRQAPKVVNYDPTTVALGAEAHLDAFSVGVELSHQQWSKGRNVVKSGLYADDPKADLRDVTDYGVSAGYALPHKGRVTIGYARRPSPWGDGHDDGELQSHVYGVDFGRLDGLDRTVYSLGGAWRWRGFEFAPLVSHTRGERTVGGSGDNVGFYSLGVTTISGALRASF